MTDEKPRYVRISLNIEWGEWRSTLGHIQSTQNQGAVMSMPGEIDVLLDIVEAQAAILGKEVAEAIGRRELHQGDVLQDRDYTKFPTQKGRPGILEQFQRDKRNEN